ncbi:MAG: ankyrin repeat domain-containing protein, partial [Synergistaceae bacterium]|nr:ankyrin repeat domain-containing protein [Synergistaceae bacterium]
KLIKLLLSKGAEINIKAEDEGIWTRGEGNCYRTPLMIAVNNNKVFYDTTESGYWGEVDPLPEIVETLINAGAKINETDSNGETALMLSVKVREPHERVIAMLLDLGADVDVECDGLRAVDFARRNKNLVGTEIFHRLESLTTPSATKRHVGYSEMLQLISNNLSEELKRVIADGADVNERDEKGRWTLLMNAARSDEPDLEIVKILLEAGADVNAADEYGDTALKKAIYSRYNENSLDLIEMLFDAGADVNIADDDGETPLIHAARCRNSDVVRLLLKLGADPNAERKGLRALDYAYGNDNMTNTIALKELKTMTKPRNSEHKISDEEMVEIFKIGSLEQIKRALEAGANVDAQDDFGSTMLMNAIDEHEHPKPELIKLLLSYGADPNAKNYFGTILLRAAYNHKLGIEIFKLLIEAGADVKSADSDRTTLLAAASRYNSPEVVKFLRDNGAKDLPPDS